MWTQDARWSLLCLSEEDAAAWIASGALDGTNTVAHFIRKSEMDFATAVALCAAEEARSGDYDASVVVVSGMQNSRDTAKRICAALLADRHLKTILTKVRFLFLPEPLSVLEYIKRVGADPLVRHLQASCTLQELIDWVQPTGSLPPGCGLQPTSQKAAWRDVLRQAIAMRSDLARSSAIDEAEYLRRADWSRWTDPRGLVDHFSSALYSPTYKTVVWSSEIWTAATRNCESFTGQACVAPESPMVWVFEQPLGIDDSLRAWNELPGGDFYAPLIVVGAMKCGDAISSTAILAYLRQGDPIPWLRINVLPHGDPVQLGFSQFAAAGRFLTLPFVATTNEHALGRSERRRLDRHNQRYTSEVSVVSLRRRLPCGRTTVDVDHGLDGEVRRHYHHQWLVSGHWRKQWYAARGVHEAIWIDPYIKGPDDKPLLTKRPTVYQAVR